MALTDQINAYLGTAGLGAMAASTLLQKQVVFQNADNLTDQVVLEVTKTQDVEIGIDISKKPVADYGAMLDYVSRRPVIQTFTAVISNINMDIRSLSMQTILQGAGALDPTIGSAINAGQNFLSALGVDFGMSEIEKKIQKLWGWMITPQPIKLKGSMINVDKINPNKANFFNFVFLISDIKPSNLEATKGAFNIDITVEQLMVVSGVDTLNNVGKIIKNTINPGSGITTA